MNGPTEFHVELSASETRALYYAVSEALRMWPGAPQRPYEEQDLLMGMKVVLFAMTMDLNYDGNDGERSEDDSPS